MSESPARAISVRGLTKRFGKHEVLRGVDLNVSAGATFAFLGVNGAGKSTTIRTLLGLEKPDGGEVRVLGMDPAKEPLKVRAAVGYLAEDQAMFPWMTVNETLKFVRPFYPGWSDKLAADLLKQFDLPVRTRVTHLSKGQRVRLGLLLAMAHEPRLFILDDPTLGLDPIMRKQLLRDVVGWLQGDGVTVFFSSHLLYEIEPVADVVAILDRGQVVRQAPTEELREQVKRLIVRGEAGAIRTAIDAIQPASGVLDVQRSERETAAVVDGADDAAASLRHHGLTVAVDDLSLDEIFEAFVAGRKEDDHAAPTDLEAVA